MIFRLSQKLRTKIKADTLPVLPLDENPFADWSASLFLADRAQYILLCNTRMLYATVLCGRGLTNEGHFINRALSQLREFMEADGQQFAYDRFIAPAGASTCFAKALDRSVTGSMNDMIRHARYWLAQGNDSLFEVGFRLNEIPMSALTCNGSRYGRPREALQELAGLRAID